jgi:hypothetical protein
MTDRPAGCIDVVVVVDVEGAVDVSATSVESG